ncbi:MAG: hypothetical protein P8Q14_02760, partial [Vicingaceae bacterium]|nr:hypothetical protein [Vicingaceae bacterium]
GYKDQFGGPKGKKFMQKSLLNLLLDNSELSLEKQKFALEENLNEWMVSGGESYEQVDDISVIGFKV